MEISFLGKTSFRFKTKTVTLVVDPVSAKEKADVVVYTGVTGTVAGVAGAVNRETPFVIDREGEYELGGVGVVMERVGPEGTLVRITGDGVEVADGVMLTAKLEEKVKEKLGEADILLTTLKGAAEQIEAAEPYIAILSGYENMAEVDQWLASHKYDTVKKDMDKLKIDASGLPEGTEIVVLNA